MRPEAHIGIRCAALLAAVGMPWAMGASAEPDSGPLGGRALYELSLAEPARFIAMLAQMDPTGEPLEIGASAADAASLLGLNAAGVQDPVAFLMQAVGAGDPAASDRIRLLELLRSAVHRSKTVVEILAERGLLSSYRERGLVAMSGDDYVRRVAGRWCDHAGMSLVVQPGAIAIAGTRFPARFALLPLEDDPAPDLLVSFLQPEPARLFLRYRPELDRLDRRFSWPGTWQILRRCDDA